ncbi:DUF1080 domain-containing protein [Blastopirellula sp. JC732]|uniref:DUF1080 domain-containing protein n=1 Tax=Blastopirellula sediminis TaxID=2894196 RepID=A0A9X1MNA5_9BACT|nr:family 16 glycoside hydrolase [Blastopirellula sediminis]MCC9607317.1 DUF1080 domain-containing protein [Blastopirellula sediminis]MCC9629390.1 DUF1080 domain-containing protein [Blastopirellula sediminis]
MMRPTIITLATAFLALFTTVCFAQTVEVEVEIKSVNSEKRTITVEYNGKATELDLSRKAVITIADTEAESSALIPGDKATVEYNKELAIVTKVAAAGSKQGGWRFYDTFNKGVDPQRAFVVSRDGRLVVNGNAGGFCISTLTEYSEYTFKVEFQFLEDNLAANPFIAIASTPPNPEAKDWTEQIPHGIEIKLNPKSIGEVVLPNEKFKVELPLGQLRDGRKVVPLRPAEMKSGKWNQLEITCDQHKNITVKVNDTTVNAVAKAESTTGYIVISPLNAEIHLRNPLLKIDEEEKPLSFETIITE